MRPSLRPTIAIVVEASGRGSVGVRDHTPETDLQSCLKFWNAHRCVATNPRALGSQDENMPKPGKIYVHFEAAEPSFTMPLELTVRCPFPLNPWRSRPKLMIAHRPTVQPDLNYDDVVDAFCQRYNTKHGASRTLNALAVQASVNKCAPVPRLLLPSRPHPRVVVPAR